MFFFATSFNEKRKPINNANLDMKGIENKCSSLRNVYYLRKL